MDFTDLEIRKQKREEEEQEKEKKAMSVGSGNVSLTSEEASSTNSGVDSASSTNRFSDTSSKRYAKHERRFEEDAQHMNTDPEPPVFPVQAGSGNSTGQDDINTYHAADIPELEYASRPMMDGKITYSANGKEYSADEFAYESLMYNLNKMVNVRNDPKAMAEFSRLYEPLYQLRDYAEFIPFLYDDEAAKFYGYYNSGNKVGAQAFVDSMKDELIQRGKDLLVKQAEDEFLERELEYIQKQADWINGVDDRNAEIRQMYDIDALGSYQYDNEYGQGVVDLGILKGLNYYVKDGVEYGVDEYRKDAYYSFLNELVNAGNNPDLLMDMQFAMEYFPQLVEYSGITPYMDDDMKQSFFTLYNSGDKEGAKAYLDSLKFGLNMQRQDAGIARLDEAMEDSAMNKAVLSGYALIMDFLGGIQGTAMTLGRWLNKEQWEDMDRHDDFYDYARYSQHIKDTVSDGIKSDFWSDVYDLGMETVGTIANMKTGIPFVLDLGQDVYADAYQREVYGLDDGDADAILANLAKAGTGAVLDKYLKVNDLIEHLPLNGVKRWIQGMPKNVKQTGSDWFKNFLTGIGKESVYMASDSLIGDDLTMYEYDILQDVANGSSYEEAQDSYFEEKTKEAAGSATVDTALNLFKKRKK